jgi:hypothetical protein
MGFRGVISIMSPKSFTYDPDAYSFITAASITSQMQQSAVNQLVLDLKSYGLWSKMLAIYPAVGGNLIPHSWLI